MFIISILTFQCIPFHGTVLPIFLYSSSRTFPSQALCSFCITSKEVVTWRKLCSDADDTYHLKDGKKGTAYTRNGKVLMMMTPNYIQVHCFRGGLSATILIKFLILHRQLKNEGKILSDSYECKKWW